MIRFACPACHTVVQIADQYAGVKVACNKCGQRIQAPAPSTVKTVLGSPILPDAAPPSRALDKSASGSGLIHSIPCPACGRKITMRGRPDGRKAPCPECGARLIFSKAGASILVSIVPTVLARTPQAGPARMSPWPPYLYGSLSLLLAVVALPAGFALSAHVVGVVAAAAGLLCGCYAAVASLLRRGVGVGFATLSVFISGIALMGCIALAGGFVGSAAHPADKRADAATGKPEGEKDDGAPADKAASTGPSGSGKDAVPDDSPKETPLTALVKKLESGSADERGAAADALGKMGDDAKPAARALCKAATDPSEDVSGKAFDALETVQPELVKPLIALVRDNNEWNRIQGAQQLGVMGSGGRPAIPALLWSAKAQNQNGEQRDEQIIAADLDALAKVGQDDPEAVGCVIQFAQESPPSPYDWRLKTHAITMLGEYSDAKGELRRKVVDCLVAQVGTLAKTPQSPEQPVFFNTGVSDQTLLSAMQAAGKFGSDAKGAAPTLKKLKLSPSLQIRDAAAATLEKIGKSE